MKNQSKTYDNAKMILMLFAFLAIFYFAKPYLDMFMRALFEHAANSAISYRISLQEAMLAKFNNTPPEPTFLTPYLEKMQPVFDVIFYEPFWRVVGFILICLFCLMISNGSVSSYERATTESKKDSQQETIDLIKREFANEAKLKFESKRISKRKYKRKINRHR